MVDVKKQTRAFIEKYPSCTPLQARCAARIVKALDDDNCQKVKAINAVLNHRGFPNCSALQILKVSTLAVWLYSKHFPYLSRDIYPIVSMVLNHSKEFITLDLDCYAKKHAQTSSANLVHDVLNEAIQLVECKESTKNK